MGDFDPHISIESITKFKDPLYDVREVRLDHISESIITPFKIFSGSKLSKSTFDAYNGNRGKVFFENGRSIQGYKSWKHLHYLLTDADGKERNQKLSNFFDIKHQLWRDSFNTLSLVFPKNPYNTTYFKSDKGTRCVSPFGKDNIAVLLDFIYANSNAMILTPDIKIGGDPGIRIDEYLTHIDNSVDTLSEWNNKPIYVPIQFDLSQSNLVKVLYHYREKGYSNIWIDFLAQPYNASYIANLRTARRLINEYLGSKEISLYFSHMQKENTPNLLDNKVLASDILTQFGGADFIGVNREVQHLFPIVEGKTPEQILQESAQKYNMTVEEYNKVKLAHKHRIFDPETYYYYPYSHYPQTIPIDQRKIEFNEEIYNLINNQFLSYEVERTKKVALDNGIDGLRKYIKQKAGILENLPIKNAILPNERQSGLIDFIGQF